MSLYWKFNIIYVKLTLKLFLNSYYERYIYNAVYIAYKTKISVLYLTIYEGLCRIGMSKPQTNALISLSCAIMVDKPEPILNTLCIACEKAPPFTYSRHYHGVLPGL